MTYKNIVFDLDDTLYDHLLPFKNSIIQCFPELDISEIELIYKRFRYWSDIAFPKYTNKQISIEELRIFRCKQIISEFGSFSISDDLALSFQKTYEKELSSITLFPELKEILEYCSAKRIPIGIITNGPVKHQLKKLSQLDVLKYFDKEKIIISKATGFQKPQIEIFDLASKNFNFLPNQTLYIGDNFENDIEGSLNAGWKSIWFNHRKRKLPSDTKIHEVQTAKDLKELIYRLL